MYSGSGDVLQMCAREAHSSHNFCALKTYKPICVMCDLPRNPQQEKSDRELTLTVYRDNAEDRSMSNNLAVKEGFFFAQSFL